VRPEITDPQVSFVPEARNSRALAVKVASDLRQIFACASDNQQVFDTLPFPIMRIALETALSSCSIAYRQCII
jgi:hypothetical protein